MTEAAAIEAMLEQWATKWEVSHPDASTALRVPYTFDNEDFSPSSLGTLGAWARVSIEPSVSEQATFGAAGHRKFFRRGTVFVQLFTPLGNGDAVVLSLVEDVRAVFEGIRIEELNLFEASARRIADTAWNARVVAIPYRLTSTR